MTKVVDKYVQEETRTLFICDFSPPRGADPQRLAVARHLDVDFVSVAYNPGKSTRVNSAAAAHWIKANTGRDVVFTLATRDMNRIATQSLLLGAHLMGLENLVVVRGDEFTEAELSTVKEVGDFAPTELVRSVNNMNRGIDFRGRKFQPPTDICVGATIDLGRGLQREIALTWRKVRAGTHFFISQPTFAPEEPKAFMSSYAERYGDKLSAPVFFGVQVMTQESIVFGDVPQWVTDDLYKGRSGVDIAHQVLSEFTEAGLRCIYLVPPILRGGRRDYEAAQAVLEAFHK